MEVNCRFNDTFGRYSCTVLGAEISEAGKVIKSFKGKHLFGKSEVNVKELNFNTGPKLLYFPRELNKYFPNLTYLRFSRCGIKTISKQDLSGLEMLKAFWIDNCRLTSLPDDLLTNMPNLRTVSFSQNHIEFASSNLLKPLIGRNKVSVFFAWKQKH